MVSSFASKKYKIKTILREMKIIYLKSFKDLLYINDIQLIYNNVGYC